MIDHAERVRTAGAFRAALAEGDTVTLMGLWSTLYANLPQPRDLDEMAVVMHRARTEAESVPIAKRLYSHCWLTDRGLASGLPDRLRPKAEQVHPKIVTGVGVSVNFRMKEFKWAEKIVERAMCDAVEDCYADGKTDPDYVSVAMENARLRAMRQLFGARPPWAPRT